jgi:hypothetical protein
MSAFLRTDAGRLINVAHIVDIEFEQVAAHRSRAFARVRLASDELATYGLSFECRDDETLRLATATVIPAQPGFAILRAYKPDADEIVSLDPNNLESALCLDIQPVIGWQMDLDGLPYPVTPDHYANSDIYGDGRGLQYPDGRVVVPEEAEYASRQEWLHARWREWTKPPETSSSGPT